MLLLRTALLATAAALLGRLAVPPVAEVAEVAVGADGVPTFEALLRAVLAVVLLAALARWVAGAVLTCVADLLARARPASAAARLCAAAAERVTPVVVRRLLTAGLTAGLATTGALAGPASADPGEQRAAEAPADAGPTALRGLPLPDRTVGGVHRTPPARAAAPTTRVRPGDSLWSISAARLPGRAPDARVAAATSALYAANADRVGDDPDLIQPGTTLRLPPLPAPHREDRR